VRTGHDKEEFKISYAERCVGHCFFTEFLACFSYCKKNFLYLLSRRGAHDQEVFSGEITHGGRILSCPWQISVIFGITSQCSYILVFAQRS